MKKLFSLLAVAALATGVGSAWAEGQQGHQGQAQPGQGQTQKGQTAQAGQRHVLQGRITDIDKNEGSVKVQTARGEINLNFPPASLSGLNQGDEVNLEVAIRPATPQQPPKSKQQQQPGQQQPGQHERQP